MNTRIYEGNQGSVKVCWNRSSRKEGTTFSLSSDQELINLKCLGPDTLSKELDRGNVSTTKSKRSFALRCGHVVYWYAKKQWHEPLCFVSCGPICCVDLDKVKDMLACVVRETDINLIWIQRNGKRRQDLKIFGDDDVNIDVSKIQVVADRDLVVLLTCTSRSEWLVRWMDSKGKSKSKIFRVSSKNNITLRGISKPHESIVVDVNGSRWILFPKLGVWSPEVVVTGTIVTGTIK